jgi:hypothetical protein
MLGGVIDSSEDTLTVSLTPVMSCSAGITDTGTVQEESNISVNIRIFEMVSEHDY